MHACMQSHFLFSIDFEAHVSPQPTIHCFQNLVDFLPVSMPFCAFGAKRHETGKKLSSAPKLQMLQFLRYHTQCIMRCTTTIFLLLLHLKYYGRENLATYLIFGRWKAYFNQKYAISFSFLDAVNWYYKKFHLPYAFIDDLENFFPFLRTQGLKRNKLCWILCELAAID